MVAVWVQHVDLHCTSLLSTALPRIRVKLNSTKYSTGRETKQHERQIMRHSQEIKMLSVLLWVNNLPFNFGNLGSPFA